MMALSSLDQERFGIVIARDDQVTAESLGASLKLCRARGVRLLIARVSSDQIGLAQELEAAGGRLMDTLIHYSRSLSADLPASDCPLTIRPFRPGDEEAVRRVAEESFAGYAGHYHADPRLERARVDEVYPSWAVRSCLSREVAGQVLVADDGDVAGFATLRLNDAREGEGVLFGVAPRARGAGVYRAFMLEGMRWCRESGAERMLVSTQLTNLAVQKTWVRLGFEPCRSVYTFHLWFPEE